MNKAKNNIRRKRHIYVIFSHSGTMPSRVIKKFTKYEYSHVSISLEDCPYEFYSFARKELNPLIGGFVVENSNTKVFQKFKNVKCKIYEIEVSEKRYEKIKRVLNRYLKRKEEYKYNFLGLLSPILHIKLAGCKNRKFCSQFVAEVLEKGSVIDLDIDPDYVTPEMLFESVIKLNPKCVFDGNVMKYFDKQFQSA